MVVAVNGAVGDGGENIDREGSVRAVDYTGGEERLDLFGEAGLELANGGAAG